METLCALFACCQKDEQTQWHSISWGLMEELFFSGYNDWSVESQCEGTGTEKVIAGTQSPLRRLLEEGFRNQNSVWRTAGVMGGR